MNEIKASTGRIVVLGRRDENLARCVAFDISEWQKLYGEGTVQLLAQRRHDTTPYPVAVTVKNGIVRWAVKEADVAVPGEGMAELQYHVGDTLAKSDTYRTLVMPALGAAGPVPPDPEKDWVETVLQAAREVEESAKNAVSEVITIGENGNWFIDGEDTGVRASGPQGEQGEQGVSGVYYGVDDPGLAYDAWINPSGDADLPGIGGFPVVEIETAVTEEATPLTEAQNALTSELIDNSMPFLLKCHFEVGSERVDVCGITTIMSVKTAGSGRMRFASIQTSTLEVGLSVVIMDGCIQAQMA